MHTHIYIYIYIYIHIHVYIHIRGVWKSRDASSVFLPNVFGGLANVGVWLSYGLQGESPD